MSIKRMGTVRRLIFCLLSAALIGTNGCRLPDGGSGPGSNSHNETLGNLTLNTDLGGPAGPDGSPLPQGYNPLGKGITAFMRKVEIYLTGVSYEDAGYSGKNDILIDFSAFRHYTVMEGSDDATTRLTYCLVASEAGDVDGNGQEEALTIFYNMVANRLSLRVLEDKKDGYRTKPPISIAVMTPPVWDTWEEYYKVDLATGDLDADGRDELVAVCHHTVYILDDAAHGFRQLTAPKTFPTTSGTGNLVVRAAVGEIDGDGREDIVIVEGINDRPGNCYYHVYSGAGFAEIRSWQIAPTIDGTSCNFEYADVTIGDFDGDSFNEIAFCGDGAGFGNNLRAVVADDSGMRYAWIQSYYSTSIDWGSNFVPPTMALDIHGDGKDEFLVLNRIVGLDGSLKDVPDTSGISAPYKLASAVGDTNGDGYDDVIVVDRASHDLWVWESNGLGLGPMLRGSNSCSNYNTTVCAPDVDGDSQVVRYTGQREQLFTDPVVIAVLAAPPHHGAGSGQNVEACGTTYGTSTAFGTEEETSTGLSVGFSFGYEFEAPFGLAKASFKTSVENSLDSIAAQSREVEIWVSYSGSYDEDLVLFTAVPFNVYYYEVIVSPNPGEIGSLLTINIPRQAEKRCVSTVFYNANNGDFPDIDSSVLGHTIGNVSSYPTRAEKNELQAAYAGYTLQSELKSISVNSGSDGVGINSSRSTSSGISTDVAVTVEAEVGAGGVTAGASAGFHYGYGYTLTNTQATFYEGAIGNIPTVVYTPSMLYSYGMFIHKKKIGTQGFIVVNYWVE